MPGSGQYLTHAHAFVDHPGFELVGFIDKDPNAGRAAAQKWGVRYFSSIEEAISNNDISVFTVAVPDDHHYSVLLELTRLENIFVFTEKPLTSTLEEAERIVALYQKKKISALINFKRSFIPEIVRLKNDILRNRWGRLISINGAYGKGFLHNGSHLLDLIVSFTRTSKWELERLVNTITDYTEVDQSYSLVIQNADKVICNIQAFDQRKFGIFELDLFFEKGRVRIIDLSKKIEISEVKVDSVFSGFETLVKTESIDTDINRSLYYSIENIYAHLNGTSTLAVPIERGLEVMRLSDHLLTAIKKNMYA
jgi:predicted dehydrogenase